MGFYKKLGEMGVRTESISINHYIRVQTKVSYKRGVYGNS